MQKSLRCPFSRWVVLAPLWTTMLLTPLAAQEGAGVGSRVRILLRPPASDLLVGTLVESRADSLRVETTPGDVLAVSRTTISRLQVSRGRHSKSGLRALIGLTAGLGGGLLAGTVAHRESQFFNITTGGVVLITALGGAVGAGLGALIGTAFKADRWEALPLVSLEPSAGLPSVVAARRPELRSRSELLVADRGPFVGARTSRRIAESPQLMRGPLGTFHARSTTEVPWLD